MNAWYQAEIRWAVMEDGKQGLREWKDAVYFFLSESRDAACLSVRSGNRLSAVRSS